MKNLIFVVWVCALSLQASILRGEDLMTLDGHTFTNITEIDKYPKLIVFTFNGTRKTAATTNLPEDFRAKHGIVIKTNTPVVAAVTSQPQLSPIDSFLCQNRESSLQQSESESLITNGDYVINGTHDWGIYKSWSITLRNTEVDLEVYSDISFHNKNDENSTTTDEMSFDMWNGEYISNVFNKFLEWENVATTNNSVDFEKEICRRTPNQSVILSHQQIFGDIDVGETVIYTFQWKDKQATLNVQQPDPYTGNFQHDDILHFQTLLKKLPSIKEELAKKIRTQQAQKNLFK